MFKRKASLCILFCLSVVTASETKSFGQTSVDDLLRRAQSRLSAIYERGDFRPRKPQTSWLPDSSGYTVVETTQESNRTSAVRYDVVTGNRTVVSDDDKNGVSVAGVVSPDGTRVITTEQGNLYVSDVNGENRVLLTTSPSGSSVSHSQATWSPDGAWIAFVQSDDSNVKLRTTLVPGDPSYPEVTNVRFARVGGTIPTLRVGVVDAAGKETRWLPITMPVQGFYLGQIDWAGNSHELMIEKLSRFRNEREFLLADVRSGAITRIFHETDPAWVDGSYGKNAGWIWIRDHQSFIVLSEQDGWRHAYLCSRDGQSQTLLTPGPLDIIERAVVDEAGGWFYFYASPDNATQKYLYRVNLNGEVAIERVTPIDQPGTHDYEFSPDAKWAFHTWSAFDKPPVTELVKLSSHETVRVLEDNEALRARVSPLISQPTEFLQLDIGDGIIMDAWMIKPAGFDPSKKYPVVVYVYGEPHAQTVLDSWAAGQSNHQRVIADLGYLVISIDNRGTPAPKGAAWRRAIFGSLGPLSTEEQAKGLQELARTRPYVDLSRVAIWGWSGGGSNTLNALFRKPEVYHVGVAVVPKPQPHLYNAWFQEIYMQTPDTNPDGYQRSAPIHFADGLKGRLLIIHGTGERNTHLQIVEGLVDRLIELGKRFDYMAYPNRDHGLAEGRGTELHVRMLITRYFVENLPPGPK